MKNDGMLKDGIMNGGHDIPAIDAHFPGKCPSLFHSQGLAVLCIRNSGFTLTNGVVSYAMDRECPHELFKFLHHLNVGTICVTDQHSKQTFKDIKPVDLLEPIQANPCDVVKFQWT
ncbi:hypothetical protein TNCV_4274411 [Trichonephila clavipes]|nr:hypothetical protein TNCV_4274411 [Trichonephila clavipes]